MSTALCNVYLSKLKTFSLSLFAFCIKLKVSVCSSVIGEHFIFAGGDGNQPATASSRAADDKNRPGVKVVVGFLDRRKVRHDHSSTLVINVAVCRRRGTKTAA